MDDVRRQLAALRTRLRLQTIVGAGMLAILAFAMGGADVVARAMVEADSWKVRTKNVAGTLTDRLVVTTDVDTARVKVNAANIELAQQTTAELNALASLPPEQRPAAGSVAYDRDLHKFKYFNGSSWAEPQAGAPTVVVKPSDESRTDATLADDAHLKFAVGPGENWTADFWLQVSTTSSLPDIKYAITVPSGAAVRYWVYSAPVNYDPVTQIRCGMTATAGTAIEGGLTNSTTQGNLVHVEVGNGANDGYVTLQWAQYASYPTYPVTIKAGSRLEATKLP